MENDDFPLELKPLSNDHGTRWLASYPDLPGCMAEGDSPETALANGRTALKAWLAKADQYGFPVDRPGVPSGKFLIRIPRTLHARLTARARQEGVSLNLLAAAILAQAVGEPDPSRPAGG